MVELFLAVLLKQKSNPVPGQRTMASTVCSL